MHVFSKIFFALMLGALLLGLVSCKDKCEAHRDANDDGKCDFCEADFEDGLEPENCRKHRDTDEDGTCDKCGTDMSGTEDPQNPPACSHRDADDNDKCDKCGADFSDGNDVSYTVTYHGLEGAENPNPSSFVGSLTLLSPKRDWYTFKGWFSDEGLTEKKTSLSAADKSTVLYAGWELATYKAEYYANGALVHTQSFGYHTQSWIAPVIPAMEGYDAAWPTLSVKPENLCINAVYTQKTYTIIYKNLDGGTHDNPQSYQTGDEILLSDAKKNGYRFTGWKNEDGVTVKKIEAGQHENLSLFATFALMTYKVTYENTQGADLSALPTEFTVQSARIPLPAITAKGYTFEGWMLDGKRVDAIESGSYGDLTLTAKMTGTAYTLVLESAYGTLPSRSLSVRYGDSFTLPVPSSAEGKIFLGWYDNTGVSGTRYTNEMGESLLPYSHFSGRVLYAHFAASRCVISFDTMGGEAMESILVDHGSAFDASRVPTKAGAVFAGWFDAELSVPYTASTVIKENLTVYAKWIESIPISSAEELIAIRENPMANYHLTKDINLGGEIWVPIEGFSGILDGNGHTVRNFSLSATQHTPCFGFFARLIGTVQNLCFKDFTLNVSVGSTAEMHIGAFAGSNEGRIYNCRLSDGVFQVTYSVPTHFCNLDIGAFAGASYGTIEDCENTVNLTTHVSHTFNSGAMFDEHDYVYYNVGGIVGYNGGTVQGCVFSGKISHTADTTGGGDRFLYDHSQIGGLIGENRGKIQNSYAVVSITASHVSHHWMGQAFVRLGGAVGSNRAVIENCYATGSLIGEASSNLNLGGFVGESYSQPASIANCYAKVLVSGQSVGGIGGFAGYLDAPVQNCYATGDVSVTTQTNVGGFVGYNQTGATVSKSYCSGSVSAAGGVCGYFAGYNGGVFFKCYYMRGATLLVGGEYKTYTVEYNTIEGIFYSTLWSEEFLKESLYWDGEGWIILANEDPILEWEISIDHDYEKILIEPTCEDFGFTVYSCKDCARYFIMDLLPAHGHDIEEGREVIAPTCTERGYTATYCRRCETVIPIDITEPIGHTEGVLSERKAPTCTEEGYELYDCKVCFEKNAVKKILPAQGHTEVLVPAKAQSCTEEGYTERSYCSVCYDVIKQKKILPKHFFKTQSIEREASCTEEGARTVYCPVCDTTAVEAISPLGHEDKNQDAKCDRCSVFLGALSDAQFIEIRTAEELANIKNALGGTYRLMQDISLPANFSPIGSIAFPFTGYFDGNGKTVTLAGCENAEVYALFGYNKGVITDLTVSGGAGTRLSYQSISATVGLLCAYNEGTLIECKTEGTFYIEVKQSFRSEKYGHQKLSSSFVFGQLAAINRPMGSLQLCQSGADIFFVAQNRADCAAPRDRYFFLDKKYKTTLIESELTLTLGMLVGRNEGSVEKCSAICNVTLGTAEKMNECLPNAVVSSRFGNSLASISYVYGLLVGVNAGFVESCESGIYENNWIFNDEEIKREIDSGMLFASSYLYRFKSEGYIGVNTSK